jgi:hypothetical protein
LVWFIFKLIIAIGAGLTIYLIGAGIVRSFTRMPPPKPEEFVLRKVNYRYRCTVCGTEVTMTSTPEGEVPDSPRHCREDMSLVVERGEY